MRVLHVLNYGWPYIDGYTVRSMGLITAQRQHVNGVDPVVAVSPFEPLASATDRDFMLDGWGPDAQLHATTHGDPDLPRSWERPSLRFAPKTTQVFRRELESIVRRLQPDLIHAHHPHYVGRVALDVAQAFDVPAVYELRCFNGDYDLMRTNPYFKLRGWGRNYLEHQLFDRASAIVTIGDGLARRIVEGRGVSEDRVFVVRNSVNTELFAPSGDARGPTLSPGDTLHLGYATTFERMENLEALVRCAARARSALRERSIDLKVTIAGTGREWDRIRRLVDEEDVGDIVSLPGFVPYGEMPDFYRNLDLFVVPRRALQLTEDTTPLKPLEALAVGTPLLSSDLPALRELLGDRDDVRFTEPTPEALAQAVVDFADGPWTTSATDIEGRSWRQEVQRYREVYRAATDPPEKRRLQVVTETVQQGYQSVTSAPRRGAKRLLRSAVDRGAFGLQPLDTHVVICGLPRTGTTLLQLVIDACVDDVLTFSGEVNGLWAARHANRNHAFMVTKRPDDIEQLGAIRSHYASNPGSVHFLLPLRDPRDLLTSTHDAYPNSQGYYVSCERYRMLWDQVRAHIDDPDTSILRYEDLVTNPDAVEDDLADRIGWTVAAPFARYYEVANDSARGSMTEGALGGMRPLSDASVGRWRKPGHRERIQEVLQRVPELPQHLIDMGYEPDTTWTNAVAANDYA